MTNVGIEEVGKLWGSIGANYIPSVAYKVKQLRFDGNIITENIPLITGEDKD